MYENDNIWNLCSTILNSIFFLQDEVVLSVSVVDHISNTSIETGILNGSNRRDFDDLLKSSSNAKNQTLKCAHRGFDGKLNVQDDDYKKKVVKGLVFVVHGIGERYSRNSKKKKKKFEIFILIIDFEFYSYVKRHNYSITVVDSCDGMCKCAKSVMKSHFPDIEGRIEYLPVDWSGVMQEMVHIN